MPSADDIVIGLVNDVKLIAAVVSVLLLNVAKLFATDDNVTALLW